MADPAARRPAVLLTPVANRAYLRLRTHLTQQASDSEDPRIGGQALPSRVGRTLAGAIRAQCLGPGDWLLRSQAFSVAEIRTQLEGGLRAPGAVLVDTSDALLSLDVSGTAAREFLSKACGLDLHPRSFPVGRCARSRFAQIPVVIECLDESPRFELIVARSYFEYLRSWCEDSAAEF